MTNAPTHKRDAGPAPAPPAPSIAGKSSTTDVNWPYLLGKAADVFRRHGFGGTSVQMLVDATGTSRTVLYDRFHDKSGIFVEALRQYCHTEANFAFASSPTDVVTEAITRFSRAEQQAPCLLTRSCCELDQLPSEAEGIVAGTLKRQWNQLIESASAEESPSQGLRMGTMALVLRHGLAALASGGVPPDQLQAVASMILRADD